MGDSALSIVLTRKNSSVASDDLIFIIPAGDAFKILYKNKAEAIQHFFYADAAQTLRYVGDLLVAVNRDTDPFHKIQFNIPCFPAVIYEVKELSPELGLTLLNRVSTTINNWPETVCCGSVSMSRL